MNIAEVLPQGDPVSLITVPARVEADALRTNSPVVYFPPPAQPCSEPAWMAGLNPGERRRIELGRLLAKSDNAIRALVVDDDAYLLLAKLAGMLDAQG